MSLTFADIYAAARMRMPSVDVLLVREWVQDAYREACDHKTWSHQRAETAISTEAQKSGTATMVKGSATVVLDGTLVLAATDVGRQFRVSSIPIYTIIAVAADFTTATLDRAYSEASCSAADAVPTSFTVLDAYWTAPADFWRFLLVADPTNKWRLRWWVTEDDLSRIDPGRMSSGSPWCLANQRYSPVPGSRGRARFELYPYVTSAKSYVVMYYTKPTVMADDTELIGPFADSKDVLIEGVLARCALWPGTSTVRNPLFNLALADRYEARFKEKCQQLEVKDEDLYPTSLGYGSYGWAPGPMDSNYLQSHVLETIESSAW